MKKKLRQLATLGMVLISLLILTAVLFASFERPAALIVPVVFACLAVFSKRITRRLINGNAGTVYSESNYLGDIVLDELNKDGSREAVTVLSGQNLLIGTVVGKATIGALSETHAGNTGNGVMTLDATTPAIANAQVGVYKVKCIAVAANSGTFEVFDPKGNSLGIVVVAATFANQIKFVIADGAQDFIAGDTFLVTVAAGTAKVKILTPAALDGTQTAYGIIAGDVDASAADKAGAAVVRSALVKDTGLVWPGGISAEDKAAALAQLASQHIISRVAA